MRALLLASMLVACGAPEAPGETEPIPPPRDEPEEIAAPREEPEEIAAPREEPEEAAAPVSEAPGGPACGAATCAAGEACCTLDCEGHVGCRPRAACPSIECATCPANTCRRRESGPCETPTGQLGNGCCQCGDDGTCASFCRCAAAGTPIETPEGPRAIETIAVGDRVISVHQGRRQSVPVIRVQRSPAIDHRVVHVRLATGAELRMSPEHPLADGRAFGELRPGDSIDGVAVLEATLEPYDGGETFDLLPRSDTGTYVASGVLVGSTLFAGAPPRQGRRASIR